MEAKARPNLSIRTLAVTDREWVAEYATRDWGSDRMLVHGMEFIISQLPGYVAEIDGQFSGLVTYHLSETECEIISLNSLNSGVGIGSALIEAVKAVATQQGCRRLFLSTTNDNVEALLFYQKRGFVLAALRREAVTESRKVKPEIPFLGNHAIPIRDEIELEITLPFPGVI